jgi:hypothetical protein
VIDFALRARSKPSLKILSSPVGGRWGGPISYYRACKIDDKLPDWWTRWVDAINDRPPRRIMGLGDGAEYWR